MCFLLSGIGVKYNHRRCHMTQTTRVVLSVEACSFIQRITGDIPVQWSVS